MRLPDKTWIFFLPLFLFSSFDFLTTYIGVCIGSGIELNSKVVGLVSKIGYVPSMLLYWFVFFLFGVWFAFAYGKANKSGKTALLIVYLSFIVLMYGRVTLINGGATINNYAGTEIINTSEIIGLPPSQIAEAGEIFYSNKERFCRLI